jgi:hypothetical protein
MNGEDESLPAEFVADNRNVGVTNPAILPFSARIRRTAARDPLVELRRLEVQDDAALSKPGARAMPITKELGTFPQARMVLVVLRMCAYACSRECQQNSQRSRPPAIWKNAHLNPPSAPQQVTRAILALTLRAVGPARGLRVTPYLLDIYQNRAEGRNETAVRSR